MSDKTETGENDAVCHTEDSAKHASKLKLVNRIAGQVSGVGKMIAEDRYCPDILNQVRAARAALRTLETRILETHLRTCVSDAFAARDEGGRDEKITEILDIFRRYV